MTDLTREEMDALYRKLDAHEKAVAEAVEKAFDEAKGEVVLTEKQHRRAIRALCALFKVSALVDASGSEFKSLSISAGHHRDIRIVAEVGRKNDEGTMGSVLSRYRRQFWVGERGGVMTFGKGARRIEGKAALAYIGSFER